MAKTICIAAPVAGIGRTTAAVNLAAALAVFEKNTLLLDATPENDSLAGAVIDPPPAAPGLADLLSGDADPAACFVQTRLDHLRVLPAGRGLEAAVKALSRRPATGPNLEQLTRTAPEIERIVIDTPAVFSPVLEWALCVADELVMPLRVSLDETLPVAHILSRFRILLSTTARFGRDGKCRPRVSGFLLNCCDGAIEAEAILGPAIFDRIRNLCLPVSIPEDPRLHEALVFGKPAVCHDIGSPGALAFLRLAEQWAGARAKTPASEREFQP